jgi:hypothetical protein
LFVVATLDPVDGLSILLLLVADIDALYVLIYEFAL